MLVPDSAHGTNPATAALAGYEVVEVKTNAEGHASTSTTCATSTGADVAA